MWSISWTCWKPRLLRLTACCCCPLVLLTEQPGGITWWKTTKVRLAAIKSCRPLSRANSHHQSTERKPQKVSLKVLRQWDEESVIIFNHRFEAVVSSCTLRDDEAKDIYLDCLKAKLREALAICVQKHFHRPSLTQWVWTFTSAGSANKPKPPKLSSRLSIWQHASRTHHCKKGRISATTVENGDTRLQLAGSPSKDQPPPRGQ